MYRSAIFFGVLSLTILLIYSFVYGSIVFALPPDTNYGNSLDSGISNADPTGKGLDLNDTCIPTEDNQDYETSNKLPAGGFAKVPESNRTIFYDNSSDANYDTCIK